eukprot:1281119-Pleurochrysis_carterae.AAC.9
MRKLECVHLREHAACSLVPILRLDRSFHPSPPLPLLVLLPLSRCECACASARVPCARQEERRRAADEKAEQIRQLQQRIERENEDRRQIFHARQKRRHPLA